ncbi:hypothetical protein BDF14DRAFT_1743380 [Spinellus fusiger]|nr:hypothetical protein BDF14DRAFT_1743380 [Spinellus fusiger]
MAKEPLITHQETHTFMKEQVLIPDNASVKTNYENMSYDEMSQRMAESYKELTEMLGHRWSTPSSEQTDIPSIPEDTHDDDDSKQELTDSEKKAKMTRLFSRTVSSGDLSKVISLLEENRDAIDVDARDEDGTTPLIYAACFGKADIAQVLLDAGAKIDIQDSFGWSALMWATNNNHEGLVKILLANGASSQQKSAKGRTVFDFVSTENHKIADILNTNPRDSMSSTSSTMGRTVCSMSSASSNAGDNDFYYHSTIEGFDSFMAEESDRRQHLLETAMALAGLQEEEDEDEDEDREDSAFDWDKCMPHQMFVFNSDDLDYILDTVITHLPLPVQSEASEKNKRQEICVPANVVFLSARFAHYYSSPDLVHSVLGGALERMSHTAKAHASDIPVLAFWMTNFSQLLYYLKKDAGLVVTTAEYQLRLSELISESYTMIVNDAGRRLVMVLEPAMLDYEEIPGMEDISFTDDWQRFFRRTTRRPTDTPLELKRLPSHLPTDAHPPTPQSVTSLLSSTLSVLQFYEVHPAIIIQGLAQFLHTMSCELFNRILTTKKRLSRSKALQVRMNLSQVEDWIRIHHLPSSLVTYINPIIQLLQLLQCLSQLNDSTSFINTVKKFDSLNALQIKRCVLNYRYEVNEPHLPEEIERYVAQLAQDSVRFRQARQTRSFEKGVRMGRAQSVSLQRTRSRRESVSQFMGSLISGVGMTASASLPSALPPSALPSAPVAVDAPNTTAQLVGEENSDDEDRQINETKDSRFMLPFSVPTTAHMVHISGWAPEDVKREKSVVPVIPEEWMETLDKGNQPQD